LRVCVYAFKVAGAAAERGDSLSEVAGLARRVGDRVRSVGVGLSPTILPAAGLPSFVIGDDEMEVGIGIHGETGIHRGRLEPADAIADRMLDMIVADLLDLTGETVSVLVNGMGATPLEELYVLYRRIAERLGHLGVTICSPFVGNYVTSLEMAGASLSVLVLDDELKELLDAPALSPFFQHGAVPVPMSLDASSEPSEATAVAVEDEARTVGGEPTPLAALLLAVLERMPAHSDELRDLDAALGDGDLGITVTAGSQAARAEIARDPSVPDAVLLARAGAGFAAANSSTFAALVGGGVIAASRTIGAGGLSGPAAAADLVAALQERIVERGHAQLGDKTIIDALDPTVAVLRSGHADGAVDALDALIAAVDVAIAATTPLQSGRGRAAWLRERSVGLKDPGMVAYRAFLTELRAVLAARA
jgi:dihydroxyacetone kinase